MVVGLGTGSTAYFAVERLGELKSGELKDIIAIPTSERTREQPSPSAFPSAPSTRSPCLMSPSTAPTRSIPTSLSSRAAVVPSSARRWSRSWRSSWSCRPSPSCARASTPTPPPRGDHSVLPHATLRTVAALPASRAAGRPPHGLLLHQQAPAITTWSRTRQLHRRSLQGAHQGRQQGGQS